MNKSIWAFVLLAIVFISMVLPAAAATKVLVITGGHGFEKKPFEKLFSDNKQLAITFAEHASKTNATAYDRADLPSYDVVVLYDMPQDATDQQKKAFLSLTDKGVGLVVLHHALCSFQTWPEYEKVIGGQYAEPDLKKPGTVTENVGWQHDVKMPLVISTNHAVTAGLKNFELLDEIYWGYRVSKDVTPLLTTTNPKVGKPVAWTKQQGKSRVVVIQPGHGKEAFENPNYRQLLYQAIQWAAGSRSFEHN